MRGRTTLFLFACAAAVAAASCSKEPEPVETVDSDLPKAPTVPAPPAVTTPPAPAEEVPHIGADDDTDGGAADRAATGEAVEDALGTEADALPGPSILRKADAIYASILQRVVTPDGLVRYELLADPQFEGSLNLVIRSYAGAELPAESTARLAFWCNAYNANVLGMALAASRQPGFEGVQTVPGFFDDQAITVAGESLTLNGLENDRIRPLGDPRIHAALVCAAMSCPPLRDEPYLADRLDEQLDDQCRRWVNDETKNRAAEGTLVLSRIFDWYGADFEAKPFGSVIGFVGTFAAPGGPIARRLESETKPLITWVEYDWALNQATGAPEGSK